MTYPFRLFFCLLVLGGLMIGPIRAGEAPNLFLSIPQGQSASSADSIIVGIDFTAISPAVTIPPAITILLPDRTITALRVGCEVRGSDDYTWRGTVSGFEMSTVVLTVMGRTVIGHIDFDAVSYTIETKNDAYLVTKKDPTRRGPLGNDARIPSTPGKRSGTQDQDR